MSDAATRASKVLMVDNDMGQILGYAGALQDAGFVVAVAESPSECMEALRREPFSVAVLDSMMSHGPELSVLDSRGGLTTGLALAKWIRANHPAVHLVCLSVYIDADTAVWFGTFGSGALAKHEVGPDGLVRLVGRITATETELGRFKAFVVHGHAVAERKQLVRWLVSTGRCRSPIVLQDEPGSGHTIIEKFEAQASDVDVVFVLATPDDRGGRATVRATARRARQNVIFELGYFCGRFRRLSGKVIVLTRGPLELPSDIAGISSIDISRGLRASYPSIRRELAHLRLE